MVSRDPDITRLVDRLSARGLVDRMPKAMLGRLGPRKLAQLARLLAHVLLELGTFP